MKITKSQLKQIIKEEIKAILTESEAAAALRSRLSPQEPDILKQQVDSGKARSIRIEHSREPWLWHPGEDLKYIMDDWNCDEVERYIKWMLNEPYPGSNYHGVNSKLHPADEALGDNYEKIAAAVLKRSESERCTLKRDQAEKMRKKAWGQHPDSPGHAWTGRTSAPGYGPHGY